jgi:hypothetical protein
MEGQLANTLKQYYIRQGNRVIFTNGMTLNELADTLAVLVEGYEVDASVLSKAINGHRLIAPRIIKALVEVLNLAPEQHWELQCAFMKDDALRRYGIDLDLPDAFPGSLLW